MTLNDRVVKPRSQICCMKLTYFYETLKECFNCINTSTKYPIHSMLIMDLELLKSIYHGGHPCHQVIPCEMHTTASFQHRRLKKRSIVCDPKIHDTFNKKIKVSI